MEAPVPELKNPSRPFDNTITIPCNKCGANVEIGHETLRIFNTPRSCIVIFEHTGPTVCGGCLKVVVPVIQGVENLDVRAVEPHVASPGQAPEPKRLIQAPPPGLKM